MDMYYVLMRNVWLPNKRNGVVAWKYGRSHTKLNSYLLESCIASCSSVVSCAVAWIKIGLRIDLIRYQFPLCTLDAFALSSFFISSRSV